MLWFLLICLVVAARILSSVGNKYHTSKRDEPPSPLRVLVEEPPEDRVEWHTDIFFDADDPKDWSDYKGQEHIKELVQLQLDVLQPGDGLKFLFIAPKGAGKTSLFRIIGSKLLETRDGRYIEVTPAMLPSKKKVDSLMGSLTEGDIICIDEIHMFPRHIADTLLPAIEDNVYPFDTGMAKLPAGISWIGATTDVGLLPEAFRDRFNVLALDTLSTELLAEILCEQPFPIMPDAAHMIASRSVGSPRELKRIFKLSRDLARRECDAVIDAGHATEAFRLLKLDHNGLYPNDRRVLDALFYNPKYYAMRADGTKPKRFAHSERAIRALTGLDESLYRDEVEPKLLRLNFLTIGTAGRELTDKAFASYYQ